MSLSRATTPAVPAKLYSGERLTGTIAGVLLVAAGASWIGVHSVDRPTGETALNPYGLDKSISNILALKLVGEDLDRAADPPKDLARQLAPDVLAFS